MATDPVDWDAEYVAGITPWDLGGVTPLLADALDEGLLGEPGRALVPGAGRAYDAGALADAGWAVTGVDISPAAAAYALEHFPTVDYHVADALDAEATLTRTGPVDLIWDHTFFCALPPPLRPRVGALVGATLRVGGLLASGVFPVDRLDDTGPPYAYRPEHMEAVLTGAGIAVERIHLGPLAESMVPGWHRRLAIWRRA